MNILKPHSPFLILEGGNAYSAKTGINTKDLSDWVIDRNIALLDSITVLKEYYHRENYNIKLYVYSNDVE